MKRIASRLALVLVPFGMAACAPVYADPWGDSYGSGYYPDGFYGGSVLSDRIFGSYPDPFYTRRDSYRSAAERDAYYRSVTAAERRAIRQAELRRQQDRAERADRRRARIERERVAAERERRRAERLDRRPVGARVNDRRDIERREAVLEARRARREAAQAERRAQRAEDRLERARRAGRLEDRIDRSYVVEERRRARLRLLREQREAEIEARQGLGPGQWQSQR